MVSAPLPLHVLFAGTFAARLADPVRAHLEVPCEIALASDPASPSQLEPTDVLVTMAFTREMAAAAPRLRLVQVPGAGLDRIDRSALPAGTRLANAYGHEVGIAEYVIGAMLALTRDLARLDRSLRRGVWESQWATDAPPPPPWPELAGKTLGIVGYGRIGQAVARRARAFDMEIIATRGSATSAASDQRDAARRDGHVGAGGPDSHVRVGGPDGRVWIGGPDALSVVLQRADYLVIAASLTDATRGLLGERELRLMRPTAIIVNVARAEIADEEALYRALAEGVVAGAALDVWYRYPAGPGPAFPARLPFHELPNVLMTPHVAGWTGGMLEARATLIARNIERAARGEEPIHLVA